MNKKEILSYETDASRIKGKAEKVAFPEKTGDVQNIIKSSNLDIVPRGGGTRQRGGAVPDNSIVIDLSKMNKITDFDFKKGFIEVEAGINTKELNEKLFPVNLEFPIIPVNEASTIGGMTAINEFDSRSMNRMKDWIEEIEFVNGRGEIMRTSKTDLGDVCGMEGITGVITKIKLRVKERSKKSAAIFQSDTLEEIMSMARRLKLERDIVMLQLFPPSVSEILELPKKYNLIIGFDSVRGKIKGEEYEKIVGLRKRAHFAFINKEYYASEDSKFFFDKLKEFVLYLEKNQIPYLSYLGSGVVYSFFKDNENEKRKQLIDLIRKTGGKFIGGMGIRGKDFVDSFERKIIQRVKLRHDPFGRINKNKLIDFEARVAAGKHLRPLAVREVEEIMPLLGEKMSASEVKEMKTPEEDMEGFIEKAEMLESEELKGVKEKEDKKEGPYSNEALLKEYEDTYESELADEKKAKVEEIAKGIAKTIVHSEKKKEITKEEEDIIKRVMLGESVKKEEK